MPYLVECWKEEKKRKHKLWCMWDTDNLQKNKKRDDTLMPQTFDDYKTFILHHAQYQFWARCEYECIVSGWPVQRREHKLDVYEQIKMNIDVITKFFIEYING